MATRFAFWRKEEEDAAGEEHAQPGLLSDFILGSQDGLVNVLGVLLGVAIAATNSTAVDPFRIILAGGLAATFAESISMGAVAYTSTLARRDHYLSELAREEREMRELPDIERKEVRDVFERWGFEGQDLEEVVDRIISKPKAWLEFMMAHELNLAPVDKGQARKSAILVGTAAIVGSFIPLIPFVLFPTAIFTGMAASLIVAAVALFVIGWYKAKTTVGRPGRSGLQMLVIGITSAIAGFLIAYLVGAAPGV
ncbi:MAG TPA: VIT1/CCC1 transporter family protein [Thermoplasmata archaeon]|nr:VIT1/CCC1 transporter family protein [Thermoplasmata archaeon]